MHRPADRSSDENALASATSLDQADRDLGVLRKTSRERRAGRTAASEDIVVSHAGPSLRKFRPALGKSHPLARRSGQITSASRKATNTAGPHPPAGGPFHRLASAT